MIKTPSELRAKITTCEGSLKCKFEGTNGKRALIVCGGTGCLSSDSAAIIEEIEKQIAERGLQDKVTVNKVGCFGFCSQGPFVKIFPEDTLYRGVSVKDVNEIFEKDILNGEVVERLLYKDPITGGLIQKQEDINFYKKQLRIALHGCGTINPEAIEEALGAGAFQGLLRALTMTPQEVIDEVLESKKWLHVFPEGSMWFYYPDIRPLKPAVFNFAVRHNKPVIPMSISFRKRKGITRLFTNKPQVDLHIGDPLYPDTSLPVKEAIDKLHKEAYHIMQVMCGINPGDPTYNIDQNINIYKKTM